MPNAFHPPTVTSLTEIDRAKVTYRKTPVQIQGVIAPGQSGWEGNDSSYHVHCVSFEIWRELPSNELHRKLTMLRPLPNTDEKYFLDFPEDSIQRFEVLLSECNTRAIIIRELQVTEPAEAIIAAAAELKKPVIVSTNLLGDLTLDRQFGWYEGEADWNGERVSVTLEGNGDDFDDAVLQTATQLWENQEDWKKRIDQCVLENLLELKNDGWLGDDETEFTAPQFLAQMSLSTISVESDGRFEFWFDDGDLFWGHSINVNGDIKNGPQDAGIAG